MPNEPDKSLSVTIEPQYDELTLDVQRGTGSVNLTVESLPVQVSRHAETAERLETPRKIAVAGDVIGDTYFDGSEDVIIGTAVECLSTMEMDALIESAMMLGG